MSKMSIDWQWKKPSCPPLQRYTLGGPTMGTRYAAVFYAPAGFEMSRIEQAVGAAVATVDGQMSNWSETSDLARLNKADLETWVEIPAQLHEVLTAALDVERKSQGAFNIAVGDAVGAAGFGPTFLRQSRQRNAQEPCPAPSLHLELAYGRARKHVAMTLDLNGIAKGYAVDRMAEVMNRHGLKSWLVGIDGELRAQGRKLDGTAWTVGHERPDRFSRAPMGVIELEDLSVATSGNYRHWREVDGQLVSHTIAPQTGKPLGNSIASATVLAPTCMLADAWATVLMVMGEERAASLLRSAGSDWIVVKDDDSVATSL